jgi:peptidoglycan LD-endopeptidase CwlK
MLTSVSLARLSFVHLVLSSRIVQLDALIPSVNLQITQGLRTWPQQDALWQQGRTKPGPVVTNAPAGYSAHNFGYAVDVVPEDIMPGQPDWNISHPAWQKILAAAPSVGLAEGAKWCNGAGNPTPDNPHLYLQELPAEPTDAMRAQFTDGGLQEVWKYFPLGS